MNEFQIMSISGVDCYEKDGVAYLRLENVARGLGFTRIADSGNEVIRWERVNRYLNELNYVPTSGHEGFIPENIFYRLAMKAKNETAEAFQAKVADDIIPSIRKTGTYTAGQSDEESDDIAIFNGYKALMRKVERLEAKVEADKPKVDFADALLVCDNCSYIEELAKHLCQIGMRTGRNRLIAEMAEDGFLCIRNGVKNMPTQKCVESGWLVIERKPHFEGDRSVMGYTTKVTPNGMQHFIEYYMRKHGLLPLLTTARQRQPRRKAISMSGYEKRDNWR